MNIKKVISAIMLAHLFLSHSVAQDLNFKLKDIDNKKVVLSELLEKGPVVISFWATWGHPCLEELKHIQKFHEDYSDSGISFYSISVDGVKDKNRVSALIRGKKYTFPVLLDTEQEVMKSFGLKDVPGIFILSREGTVIYRHAGYKPGDEAELERNIHEIIRPKYSDSNESGRDTLLIKTEGDSL
jgi:peroxiredoxin